MATFEGDKKHAMVPGNLEVSTSTPDQDGNDVGVPSSPSALSGQKRKVPEAKKKPAFKAVGHLVMAMRRFQASLNPTYTYGKQTSSGSHSARVTEDGETPVTSTVSPQLSRRMTYDSHGHKASFLLRNIPPLETEEEETA